MANQGIRLLNRDAIKYIAVFTMLLNHISAIFLQPGSLLGDPSSVEVLGMFRSFCSNPLPSDCFMISQMLIFPGKIVAPFGLFFIEKIFMVCYNDSTL